MNTDNKYLRIDHFFSYWIVIWFFIYLFLMKTNIINEDSKKYLKNNLNPKFAIYIALIENICILLYLIIEKSSILTIIKYTVMISIFKIIPLYILQNEKIKLPQDLIPVSVLFIIYNIYLASKKTSFYDINNVSIHHIINGSDNTPFFRMVHYITVTMNK